jgi:hypothetical protein
MESRNRRRDGGTEQRRPSSAWGERIATPERRSVITTRGCGAAGRHCAESRNRRPNGGITSTRTSSTSARKLRVTRCHCAVPCGRVPVTVRACMHSCRGGRVSAAVGERVALTREGRRPSGARWVRFRHVRVVLCWCVRGLHSGACDSAAASVSLLAPDCSARDGGGLLPSCVRGVWPRSLVTTSARTGQWLACASACACAQPRRGDPRRCCHVVRSRRCHEVVLV